MPRNCQARRTAQYPHTAGCLLTISLTIPASSPITGQHKSTKKAPLGGFTESGWWTRTLDLLHGKRAKGSPLFATGHQSAGNPRFVPCFRSGSSPLFATA